jgi:hypothetical protein
VQTDSWIIIDVAMKLVRKYFIIIFVCFFVLVLCSRDEAPNSQTHSVPVAWGARTSSSNSLEGKQASQPGQPTLNQCWAESASFWTKMFEHASQCSFIFVFKLHQHCCCSLKTSFFLLLTHPP